MADKHSEKTDAEMLDQTFGGMDTSMGSFEDEDENKDKKEPVAGKDKPVKKKNDNLLWIGVGGACVLYAAWIFVIKPMFNSPQQVQPAQVVMQQPEVTPQIPQNTQMPQQTVTPPAPNDGKQYGVVPTQPDVKPNNQNSGQNPNATVMEFLNQKDESQGQKNPVQQLAQVQPKVEPVQTPIQAVDSEKSKVELDTRITEFRMILNNIDSKINEIEKSMLRQEDINKEVDRRLSALEAKGKVVKKSSNTEQKKKSVKPVAKNEVRKDSGIKEEEVLVDKSKENNQPMRKKDEVNYSRQPEVIKEDLGMSLKLHSMYSGRVWFKNPDGTLSTYQEGERLSTGELIKKIDMEKFEVVTDKRVISR